ncbi:hypothetical protein An03g01970 [Aspergillus niger]|uniref:Uncharacterized protein n=2 Tax=Aspergillus niger TaxID=5061 RepID=A2QG59_ASPNC|nr:hypothetical protein An03g01970 [Aspergillus niger]CAK38169.1 hypothetical protein An03g01970 [Aspergillus niger]
MTRVGFEPTPSYDDQEAVKLGIKDLHISQLICLVPFSFSSPVGRRRVVSSNDYHLAFALPRNTDGNPFLSYRTVLVCESIGYGPDIFYDHCSRDTCSKADHIITPSNYHHVPLVFERLSDTSSNVREEHHNSDYTPSPRATEVGSHLLLVVPVHLYPASGMRILSTPTINCYYSPCS